MQEMNDRERVISTFVFRRKKEHNRDNTDGYNN
jgi:hypothetical protein